MGRSPDLNKEDFTNEVDETTMEFETVEGTSETLNQRRQEKMDSKEEEKEEQEETKKKNKKGKNSTFFRGKGMYGRYKGKKRG